MSRIAKNPVVLPKGVEVALNGQSITVKGPKGSLTQEIHRDVQVSHESGVVKFVPRHNGQEADALAGTTRALVMNMVLGTTKGFERKLDLVGVGYRAQAQGKKLNLSLGYSHPVEFAVPEGVNIETPSQTEILIKGMDKQKVGQTAANIRSYRLPEPYKGKGVKYSNEVIVRNEAKKK